MTKHYLWVFIIYLLNFFLIPTMLLSSLFLALIKMFNIEIAYLPTTDKFTIALTISSLLTLLGTALILRKPLTYWLKAQKKFFPSKDIIIIIATVVAIFIGQSLMLIISQQLNLDISSDNTKEITELASMNKWFIFIPLLYAPIMEELIFRKIFIAELPWRLPLPARIIFSSVLFSLFHGELTHFHVYMSVGLILGFVYYKTKRLIIPITAHFILNLVVLLVQFTL